MDQALCLTPRATHTLYRRSPGTWERGSKVGHQNTERNLENYMHYEMLHLRLTIKPNDLTSQTMSRSLIVPHTSASHFDPAAAPSLLKSLFLDQLGESTLARLPNLLRKPYTRRGSGWNDPTQISKYERRLTAGIC